MLTHATLFGGTIKEFGKKRLHRIIVSQNMMRFIKNHLKKNSILMPLILTNIYQINLKIKRILKNYIKKYKKKLLYLLYYQKKKKILMKSLKRIKIIKKSSKKKYFKKKMKESKNYKKKIRKNRNRDQ